MTDTTHPVPKGFAAKANLSPADYEAAYARSIKDPEGF